MPLSATTVGRILLLPVQACRRANAGVGMERGRGKGRERERGRVRGRGRGRGGLPTRTLVLPLCKLLYSIVKSRKRLVGKGMGVALHAHRAVCTLLFSPGSWNALDVRLRSQALSFIRDTYVFLAHEDRHQKYLIHALSDVIMTIARSNDTHPSPYPLADPLTDPLTDPPTQPPLLLGPAGMAGGMGGGVGGGLGGGGAHACLVDLGAVLLTRLPMRDAKHLVTSLASDPEASDALQRIRAWEQRSKYRGKK